MSLGDDTSMVSDLLAGSYVGLIVVTGEPYTTLFDVSFVPQNANIVAIDNGGRYWAGESVFPFLTAGVIESMAWLPNKCVWS